MTFPQILRQFQARFESPVVRRIFAWARSGLVILIIGLLGYQLTRIGWQEFLGSLPTTPYYFILFLCIYLTLPLSEVAIFRSIWQVRSSAILAASLKKRVLNKDILGYSGEVYLAVWGSKETGRPRREIAAEVKDSMILSIIVNNLWTAILLGTLFFSGQLSLLTGSERSTTALWVAGLILVVAALTWAGTRFRHTIFRLPGRDLVRVGLLHCARVVCVSAFQILQWKVVMPEVSTQTWFTFLAVSMVISRIPVLPSRDLLFVGAGIEMSRLLAVASAPLAGMLLVSSVLDKLVNLVLFTVLSRPAGRSS